jgi:hypothetical protein
MNADELRATQAPLKQLYRDTPDAARIEARAEGSLDPKDIAIVVDAWHGKVTAGLRAVATAMGVTIHGGKVIAEGIWDARGTLGVDRATPVGLTEVTVKFEVDCDADRAKLERMIQTTERYCVILQTLKSPPKIAMEIA